MKYEKDRDELELFFNQTMYNVHTYSSENQSCITSVRPIKIR